MVRRGEYLERAVVIPGAPVVEGLYHRGATSPSIVIAPPHPERGGSMELAVIAELAWALTRAGHATLRFNYPGVGASPGTFTSESRLEATHRALEHLEACTPNAALAGAGIGLGGKLLMQALRGRPGAALVWVRPEAETLSALAELDTSGFDGGVWLVVGAQAASETVHALQTWAQTRQQVHVRAVPEADPLFTEGLVGLGRTVQEIFEGRPTREY